MKPWPAGETDRTMNEPVPLGTRIKAYGVHVYTASGLVPAAMAMLEVCKAAPDARWVFFWLLVAVFIDMTDGFFARRFEVKKYAPTIDGRKIDDIVDFLTFTFIPLVMIVKLGWVPEPGLLWVAPALVASVLGFSNVGAKAEEDGYFLGFPSYWNVAAFYAGYWATLWDGWLNAAMLLGLAVLTLVPVGFIYPTLAPKKWRVFMIVGGYAWCLFGLWMLPSYPNTPGWAVWASILGPVGYGAISLVEWFKLQKTKAAAPVGTTASEAP